MVHMANDGTETYELRFRDDDGNTATECRVLPDGTIELVTDDDEFGD